MSYLKKNKKIRLKIISPNKKYSRNQCLEKETKSSSDQEGVKFGEIVLHCCAGKLRLEVPLTSVSLTMCTVYISLKTCTVNICGKREFLEIINISFADNMYCQYLWEKRVLGDSVKMCSKEKTPPKR